MSGTDVGHTATILRSPYAMSGTDVGYTATILRSPYAMSGTDIDNGATILRTPFAMSGTDVGYATSGIRTASAMSSTDKAYDATLLHTLCDVRLCCYQPREAESSTAGSTMSMVLRAFFAMAGTETVLCIHYEISGTEISVWYYQELERSALEAERAQASPISLRACYAMSGTETA
eukprot:1602117-Rhodomonas_salina.1